MFEEMQRKIDRKARAQLQRLTDEQLDGIADHITDPVFRGQCPESYGQLVALEMNRRKDIRRSVA